MIENLPLKTGKDLSAWITIVKENNNLPKHRDKVKWLMEQYQLGLNYADLIVHKASGTDAASQTYDDLIFKQYKGKEPLKFFLDNILEKIKKWSNDIEVHPKNAYVSLKRGKQFACLKPATKTRFEVELILKGVESQGLLEKITVAGAMCTHKIRLENKEDLTEEVFYWLKFALESASKKE